MSSVMCHGSCVTRHLSPVTNANSHSHNISQCNPPTMHYAVGTQNPKFTDTVLNQKSPVHIVPQNIGVDSLKIGKIFF